MRGGYNGVVFITEGIHTYVLSPLASRLSPLASRLSPLGIIAALLIFLPLFLGYRAAFARDWVVTYYRLDGTAGTDTKTCGANSEAKAEKQVTYIATLNWQGTGPRPIRVEVTETATVSWAAELRREQTSAIKGQPPLEPNGSMTGHGETGLSNEITTLDPDPWTTSEHGEDIVGTRKRVVTLSADGNAQLSPVTVKASATATTGADTTGGAAATVVGYSVSVGSGSAWATASVDIAPTNSGWVGGRVDYGEENDGTYISSSTAPSITVVVGDGASKTKDISASQKFIFQGSQANFTAQTTTKASGAVSTVYESYSADSLAEITGGGGTPAAPSSGSAPVADKPDYDDHHGPTAYSLNPIVHLSQTPVTSDVTITLHLHASASAVGN